MSGAHGIVRSLSTAARSLRARAWLRGAQRVGASPHVLGEPWIENRGRLEIGSDFTLGSTPIQSHIVVGARARVTIGDRVSIGHGAAIASDDAITIGDGVVIAPMVMIMDTDFHDVTSMAAQSRTVPVVIEARARIGEGAVLLKGSHVGEGAVVLPGSVVSGTVAPGTWVRGVPAREVRDVARGPSALDPAEAAERIARIVAETFQVSRAVTADDGPATLPGWDSLGVLRLLVTLEDELGIRVDAERLAAAKTVRDVIAVAVSP